MTPDLDAIKARLAAATPGPWETRFLHRVWMRAREEPGNLMFGTGPTQDWADCDLMAHAPTDLAALVAEVERLHQAIRDLLPYATAAIGNPRSAWPTDSVILKAEALLPKESTDAE